MSTNKVYVTYTETYDLSTVEGGLGLVGIHTPKIPTLYNRFEGLFKQFKKIKFLGMNMRLACASLMPLDPLQVGLAGGEVNPQDIFNPILYTAVSNESMGTLLDRIYSDVTTNVGPSVEWDNMATDDQTSLDPLSIYYGLLSQDNMAKAMPQQGIVMNNVKPLCHTVAVNVAPTGYMGSGSSSAAINGTFPIITGGDANGTERIFAYGSGTVEMPSVPTMVPNKASDSAILRAVANDIAPIYVSALVLPPAITQRLFFRMTISWKICFSQFRDLSEIYNLDRLASLGGTYHVSDYETQSASMTALTDVVDGDGTEIALRMASVS